MEDFSHLSFAAMTDVQKTPLKLESLQQKPEEPNDGELLAWREPVGAMTISEAPKLDKPPYGNNIPIAHQRNWQNSSISVLIL